MGYFKYPMTLVGPEGEATLEATVDTGAIFNVIPRSVLEVIGVSPTRKATFRMADGRRVEYDLATVTTRLNAMETPTVCIFGEADMEPILGVVTLEIFLLGVDTVHQTLIPIEGKLLGCRICPLAEETARGG